MDTWKQLSDLARQRRRGEPETGEKVSLRTLRPLLLFFGALLALTVFSRVVAPRAKSDGKAAETQPAQAKPPATINPGPATSANAAALAVFAPESDLGAREADLLAHAQHTLDVAMDSFTDMQLARRLIAAEARGVVVRVYRDHTEYVREESARGTVTTTALLRSGGVAVRVKSAADGPMGLRAYVLDGVLIRTGSASWSTNSLAEPDQAIFFTQSPAAARVFEANFERLWSRPGNIIVP